MNYIGGKYKLLPQIINYFPEDIDSFVDLFAGGLDVGINVSTNKVFCNDINYFLIDIYIAFQNCDIESLLAYIDNKILEYNLSKTNLDGYLKLRKDYNLNKYPLDLFVLVCYSFNHQLRFNSKHEFNTPFGKNRSSFNSSIRQNLIKFHDKVKKINFSCINFKDYDISDLSEGDFLYADPPYLITCGSYNDGKRGFEGWGEEDDVSLFEILDKVDSQGAKFALSNVIEHKGQINSNLLAWAKKYNVHQIDYNYNNSNYQTKNKMYQTKEVLIVNY
jgi:DNA adenine methylase Dam